MKTKFNEFLYESDIPLSWYKNRGNSQSAVAFDKKYNTKISQKYNYPNNLSEKEVWNIVIYFLYKSDAISDSEIKKDNNLLDILNKLDDFFPYEDISNLDMRQKFHVLYGMVSGFNSDDIIWYSINKITGTQNNEVEYKLSKLPQNIKNDVGWVMSPKTFDKIKNILM